MDWPQSDSAVRVDGPATLEIPARSGKAWILLMAGHDFGTGLGVEIGGGDRRAHGGGALAQLLLSRSIELSGRRSPADANGMLYEDRARGQRARRRFRLRRRRRGWAGERPRTELPG